MQYNILEYLVAICEFFILMVMYYVQPDSFSFKSADTWDGLPFVKLFYVKNDDTNKALKIMNKVAQ